MRGLAATWIVVAGAMFALVMPACDDVDDVAFFLQVGSDFDDDLDDFDGGGLVIVIRDDDDDDDDESPRVVNRQDVRPLASGVSRVISVPPGAARLGIEITLEGADGEPLGGGRVRVRAPEADGASLHVRLGGDPSAGCSGCSERWAFPVSRGGAAAESLFVAWDPGTAGRPIF